MSDNVRINGNLYSWSSTIFKIGGVPYTGLSEISWGQKRTRTKAYGMGKSARPRGRTGGKVEFDNLKVKFMKDTAQVVRKQFAALSDDGKSYGNADSLPASLQYVDGNDEPITVEFDDLAVAVEGSSEKEGADPSMEDWEFDIMGIRVNGLSLYDATAEAG
jgi:hypothetical protein